jgi:hypothetical protein
VTFIFQAFGSASKGDLIQKLQRLTWVPFAEIQTLNPSSSRQPHSAHPESNPGLQVSTFSRDARTHGTKEEVDFPQVDEIRT